MKKETVEGVEGAFVIRNALTAKECDSLSKSVQFLVERNDAAIRSRIAAVKGGGDKDHRRRPSQHHTPCRLEQASLRVLCSRLRPFFPCRAGPASKFVLASPGHEVSSFLRLYDYQEGEFSSPHYDRSFSVNEKAAPHTKGGRLLQFSAYSLLFYLTDAFEGGHTTFFPKHGSGTRDSASEAASEDDISSSSSSSSSSKRKRSRRGNTDKDTEVDYTAAVSVEPRTGDVLVFPHGKQPGCYPDPLHEGSLVRTGRKTIIRTDVMFCCPKNGES